MRWIAAVTSFYLALPIQALTLNDSNRLFDWAEAQLPAVFSPAGVTTYPLGDYLVRYYPDTNVYLATRGEEVWLYNAAGLQSVGLVSHYIALESLPRPENNLPGTGQDTCTGVDGAVIDCADTGQDAAYRRNPPGYIQIGDGTVLDTVTGLQWQQSADLDGNGQINASDKRSPNEATSYCDALVLGGFDDWRLPNIKTLYSLIDFRGLDASGNGTQRIPFLNTTYFAFGYGDTSAGEREIDAQWATSTRYVSTTMNGAATIFGLNLADGRIKGYPVANKTYYVQCVRGDTLFGQNRFEDQGNATVLDAATGLVWQQDDGGRQLDWPAALDYCQALTLAGHDDWRLPDAHALQSIVDYTRAPATTQSAALDPVFISTAILNEAGAEDWPSYWSSTTHLVSENDGANGRNAVYVAFGRALGYFNDQWLDVHGAGAQRSDPKAGTAMLVGQRGYQVVSAYGGTALVHGPQGDVVRDTHAVRCVRGSL